MHGPVHHNHQIRNLWKFMDDSFIHFLSQLRNNIHQQNN